MKVECELRETLGRDKGDAFSGRLLATFKADMFSKTDTLGNAGTSTSSNDSTLVLLVPYLGIEIIPRIHTIVVRSNIPVALIVISITEIPSQILRKTKYKVILG